jgi:hypothetical protein
VNKSELSPARRRLVEMLQRLNFGRIEGLLVRAGEPLFDPPPRQVREVKFGGENGARPEAAAADFALKAQVAELFRHLDELGDGTVEALSVKHGLPFAMQVVEPAA